MASKTERKINWKFSFFLFFSFLVVAFGQNVWIGYFCYLSAFCGCALFWKAMMYLPKKKHQFLLGTCWFFSVQLVQLSWMSSITYVGALIFVVYIALSLWLGIQFGLISLLFPQNNKLNYLRILTIASVWVLFEWSRLFILSGFSWNPLGLALTNNHFSMQLASVFGVYGLSFWVILVNLVCFKALTDIENVLRTRILWICLFAYPYLFGMVHESICKYNMEEKQSLAVLLIQTSLLPEQKDPMTYAPLAFIPPVIQWQRILGFLEENQDKKIDLIVLPEAALPFGADRAFYSLDSLVDSFDAIFEPSNFDFLPKFTFPLAKQVMTKGENKWRLTNLYWAQAISNFMNAEVVIGLDDHDNYDHKNYNAAFHFIPWQKNIGRYEKQILLPLVEYFPFSWCKKLMKIYGISEGFTAGTEAKVFKGKIPLSISICYEETLGGIMRNFRKNGANLLVNISNDGWFPLSRLPNQHFEHGKVRSVENGIPLIRACNTGITGGTDCFGRVIKVFKEAGHSSEKISGALYFEIPTNNYSTLYTFWGDKFILILSSVIIIIFTFNNKKNAKRLFSSQVKSIKRLFISK